MHSSSPFILIVLLGPFSWSLRVAASRQSSPGSSAKILEKRQNASSSEGLIVDLGYERYQGFANSTSGLNTWLGIRFSAPPIGQQRWQPPNPPEPNRQETIQADKQPPKCPQTPTAVDSTSNEDCLFVNVYAPPNAKDYPVYVWIHGGGYTVGQADYDLATLMNANNNSFVGVAIQYRLGAFGFLSSDEVKRFGAVNAGLLDQQFAFQWVKDHIHLFGGEASRVTISGESAGAGSVMLHALAYGGSQGDSLFRNIHAASPYLPQQYGYADFVPSQAYYAFASAAGCFGPPALPRGNISTSVFQCLVNKDTETLQKANSLMVSLNRYAIVVFLPVTDGALVQQLPSQQLFQKKLNGVNLLIGNNANEGPSFTPQDIDTEDGFLAFTRNTFPLFDDATIDKLLDSYPLSAIAASSKVQYATNGTTFDTALNVSSFATGAQQMANNLYAETTFVCPAYWMAEAFTDKGRKAYKYQYSVPGAQHGADVLAYFGPPYEPQGEDFARAVRTMLGNFVIRDDPSISAEVARGGDPDANIEAATAWPLFSTASPLELNLNNTGGTLYSADSTVPGLANITQTKDPGLKNDFQAVDAFKREGGRGKRCDFWRSVGSLVPE